MAGANVERGLTLRGRQCRCSELSVTSFVSGKFIEKAPLAILAPESLGIIVSRGSSGVTAPDWTQMDDIAREYARLTPLAHLHSPSASPGTFNRVHDVLLNKVLLDAHLRAYPPAPEYQLKFWKWAVQKLEALLGDDVSLQASNSARGYTL